MKVLLTLLFIILIIASVAGTIWFVFVDKAKKKSSKRKSLTILTGCGFLFLSIFGLIALPGAMYTVSSGEIAVIKTYGKITDTAGPGLHIRNIFTQTYELYDTKVQQINLDKWIYVQDNKQVTQAVQVLATVQFQLNESNVKEIANEYGTLTALTNRLEVVLLGTLENSSSGIELETLITGAGKLNYQSAVIDSLRGSASTVQTTYYLSFRNIVIQEFILEPALEEALMKIRIAEAEKATAQLKYEQETLRVIEEGKQAVQKATADAEAAKAKAAGDAAVLDTITEAEVRKITAIAEAEAKAVVAKLEQLMETLTDNGLDADLALAHVERLAFLERWDGKLPETVVGDLAELFDGLLNRP